MPINIQNFLRTSLRAPITPTTTVLQLEPGSGSKFNIPAGDYCYLTLRDRLSYEIVRYTSTGAPVVGDTISVARGQDASIARSFPAGTCVQLFWNEQQITELIVEITNAAIANQPPAPSNTIFTPVPPTTAPAAGIAYAVNFGATPAALYAWNASTGVWVLTGTPAPALAAPPVNYNAVAPVVETVVSSTASTFSLAVATQSNLKTDAAGQLAGFYMYATPVVVPPGANASFTVSGPPNAVVLFSGSKNGIPDSMDAALITLPASGVAVVALTNIPGFTGDYFRWATFRDAAGNWLGQTATVSMKFL